ncbi:MAG: hypothetical protein OEZ06_16000 [Myxococcales bacterium]|nr:hypothetical protein [Myxococcales bacterium]
MAATDAEMEPPDEGFEVTCAVPRAGRTLLSFLEKLKAFGVNAAEIDAIAEVLARGKKHSSTDMRTALAFLEQAGREAAPCLSIFVDRKRPTRPYRIGFLSHEWEIGGIRVRVEGEEPHNGSSLIKLDEVDVAVVGLDELLSMTQYYLRQPTTVTKWGMFNYNLERPTSIRVAGSAMLGYVNDTLGNELQDIVGFFLISKAGRSRKHPTDLQQLAASGQRVFVKGRYTGVVSAAYPQLNIASVDDVEDAVMASERGSVGLEIVQSGNTVKKKGLELHGAPLFLSESLYVVDYDRYLESRRLRDFVKVLGPVGYFDERRIQQLARWYYALEQNLGDAWVDKPPPELMLCADGDAENGLRPYRLRTRHWKPSDDYKRDEALAFVEEAKGRLLGFYRDLGKP